MEDVKKRFIVVLIAKGITGKKVATRRFVRKLKLITGLIGEEEEEEDDRQQEESSRDRRSLTDYYVDE